MFRVAGPKLRIFANIDHSKVCYVAPGNGIPTPRVSPKPEVLHPETLQFSTTRNPKPRGCCTIRTLMSPLMDATSGPAAMVTKTLP